MKVMENSRKAAPNGKGSVLKTDGCKAMGVQVPRLPSSCRRRTHVGERHSGDASLVIAAHSLVLRRARLLQRVRPLGICLTEDVRNIIKRENRLSENSSAGRAPLLGSGGRGFKSRFSDSGSLA